MRLRYTLRGAAELDEILAYIEERSPQGAHHVQARIQAVINLLLHYPYAGQLTSKDRLRRVVASPYPYLIFTKRSGTTSLFTRCAIAPAVRQLCQSDHSELMRVQAFRM